MALKLRSTLGRWWHSPKLRGRVLLSILALIAFGLALLAGAWTQACNGNACPSIAELDNYDPAQASKVYAADGRLISDFGLQRRTVITLKQMSPALVAAFLEVEDKRFYSHHGIDFIRVLGSFKAILLRRQLQGFSTITMQLARNLWPETINPAERKGLKGMMRKIREARVALEIERKYKSNKDHILELYLNQINLGNRAYGVETASQRYFGKSARDLNVAEAATLAAIPRAPERYNPRKNPGFSVLRRNLIIGLLRDDGKLSPGSSEAWKAYPLRLSSRSDYSEAAEYAVEYVRQEMAARFGEEALYRDGLQIYTTIDLDIQESMERNLTAQLDAIEGGAYGKFPHKTYRNYIDNRPETPSDNSPYLQTAAVTIEARTGAIRAMVGGRDYQDSKFNRATQAYRQAGSTFKPFVYATAVMSGIPLSQISEDSPVSIPIPDQPIWEPKNYDNKFEGQMSLRRALYMSRNTVAVKLGLKLGEDAVVATAAKFGITTRIPHVPSIFIGAADVIPLEMVAAFTTFANLGRRVTPNIILRVEDRAGTILWQPETEQIEVMDRQHAWLILDALRDVIRRGTANGAVVGRGFTLPAGGKTGTTNDGVDVWFIGFTSDLVTGMWMGFDQRQKIKADAQGGRLVAPAWTAMMREVYERRKAPADWVQPEGLISVDIDESTGELWTQFCPADQRATALFFPGTEPKEPCRHSPFRGAGTTGK